MGGVYKKSRIIYEAIIILKEIYEIKEQ